MKGNFMTTVKEYKQREYQILSELVCVNEEIQKKYFDLKGKSSEFKLKAEKLKITFTQSIIIIYYIIERSQV